MSELVYIDKKGYCRFKDSNIFVHRWAAEKKIGRKLLKGEVVHHIDRNKLNNWPGNLFVCKNQRHHSWIHFIDAMRFGWKVSLCGFQKTAARV